MSRSYKKLNSGGSKGESMKLLLSKCGIILLLLTACSPNENNDDSGLVFQIHNSAKEIGIEVPQIVGSNIEATIEKVLAVSEFRGFQNPVIALPIDGDDLEAIAALSMQLVQEVSERRQALETIGENVTELGGEFGLSTLSTNGLSLSNEGLLLGLKEDARSYGYFSDDSEPGKLPISDLREILEFTEFLVKEIPRAEFSELVLAITLRKTAVELAVLTRGVSDMDELDAGEYGIPENFWVNSQMHGATVEDGTVKMTWRLDGSRLSGITYTLRPESLVQPILWIEGGTCLELELC